MTVPSRERSPFLLTLNLYLVHSAIRPVVGVTDSPVRFGLSDGRAFLVNFGRIPLHSDFAGALELAVYAAEYSRYDHASVYLWSKCRHSSAVDKYKNLKESAEWVLRVTALRRALPPPFQSLATFVLISTRKYSTVNTKIRKQSL